MEHLTKMAQFVTSNYHSPSHFFLETTLAILLLLIIGYYAVRDYGIPPGPIGVPLLGYYPFLSKNSFQQQIALKKKYGDIYSFRVTGKLLINLASRKVLQEAYVSKFDIFINRPTDYFFTALMYTEGLGLNRGEKWKTMRKFFVNHLKERGVYLYQEHEEGSEFLKKIINSFIYDLKRNADKPVDIMKKMSEKNSDILFHTFFGLKSPVAIDEITKMQENHMLITSLFRTKHLILVGKIAKYLVAPFLPWKKGLKIRKIETEKLKRIVEEHKISFNNLNIRDIIDSYIDERNKRKSKGDPTAEYFTDETLVDSLFQFLSDGLNIAQFISASLKLLIEYPDEQEKIYKELVEVCGEDRNPTISDRSKTTYTTAFLFEALRVVNRELFADLECSEETTLGGYRIPKGAITVINADAINNDPENHKDPEKFNPERYISKEGKPREELPVAFGIGKRTCLGEKLVLMIEFLFVTALVKNFKISYSKSKSVKSMRHAKKFEICLTPRK